MGKRDRRSSMKMNRRTAQAKKKARIKKHRAEHAAQRAEATGKKPRAAKPAAAAPAAS